MKYTALENFDKYWFTPEGQEEGDEARFYLQPLYTPQAERLKENAIINKKNMITGFTANAIEQCLKENLLNWENYQNSKGDVKFNQTEFRKMPMFFRSEIVSELYLKNAIPENIEKNSESQP